MTNSTSIKTAQHSTRKLPNRLAKVVADVLYTADAGRPADQVLRTILRAATALSREDSRTISETVFAYYRWRHWLNPADEIGIQAQYALDIQGDYDRDPSRMSDAALREKAVPAWLGSVMEVPVAWLRTLQHSPKLWLRARLGKANELISSLGDAFSSPWPACPDAVGYFGESDLFKHPSFQQGQFEIQDLSSQFVSHFCNPAAGETWWDACAGEGGKALHLSDLMLNKGLIWATDRAAWRLKRLKQRAARARMFNFRTAEWKRQDLLPTRTLFDGVLIDAPCSGIGTWQRNPHARWTLRQEEIEELAEVQHQLLRMGAAALKPGGRLVYAVCTLTRAETEETVEWVDRHIPRLQKLSPEIPGLEHFRIPNVPNAVRIWPQQLQGQGMFVAQWRKA